MDNPAEASGIDLLAEKDFIYLSAERVGAEAVYQQNLTDEYRIGVHGEYTFDYLSVERMNELREPAFLYPELGVNLEIRWITGSTILQDI